DHLPGACTCSCCRTPLSPLPCPLFFLITRCPRPSTLFPYTTLFRSRERCRDAASIDLLTQQRLQDPSDFDLDLRLVAVSPPLPGDRKSTRLNSSHVAISYAVFCLKKKTRPFGERRPVRSKSRLRSTR